MQFELNSFKSKVARRIFFSFIACAIIPIVLMAVLTLVQVGSHLNQKNKQALHRTAKSIGMTLFEHIQDLDAELRSADFYLQKNSSFENQNPIFYQKFKKHFSAVGQLRSEQDLTLLLGSSMQPPQLTEDQRNHLEEDKTVLYRQGSATFLLRSIDKKSAGPFPVLIAQIRQEHLWEPVEKQLLPWNTELSIVNSQGEILYTTFPGPVSLSSQAINSLAGKSSGFFHFRSENEQYKTHFWSIFFKFHFQTDKWVVLLHTSISHFYAAFNQFTSIFILVCALTMFVVLFLSSRTIRAQLVPLEKLRRATKRLAEGDFSTEVAPHRDDEFAELIASFNSMSHQLGQQFRIMSLTDEINRSILGALNTETIVATVLEKMPALITCDSVEMLLLEDRENYRGHIYSSGFLNNQTVVESVELTKKEIEILRQEKEWHVLEPAQQKQSGLSALYREGSRLMLLSIQVRERLAGVLIFAVSGSGSFSEEDKKQARHLTDQIAVALSNAKLLEELDAFNWGTLHALARAIDTKSPWTAGHSERVTQLALRIGRHMGLNEEELDIMHRGGLLHDIGKLGVPSAILDKPGKLTDEEYRQICEHTRMGARILNPIPAFSQALTIVLHHHEQYDGKGYPYGLAGKDIALVSRIFAVADNYDALVSGRPYHPAMHPETVLNYVKEQAGLKFDPEVVQAFLEVVAKEYNQDKARFIQSKAGTG